MAPVYLLDIYKIIDTLLDEIHNTRVLETDPERSWFVEGQLDALTEVREYLRNGYEGKLPKRLRERNMPLGNQDSL